MKNFIKNGIIPIGAYCSPMPPKGDYPNKITEEQYKAVKDAGIDIIYAHSEVMNSPTEEYAFLSLDLAEKTGLTVFVRDEIAKEYVALGDKDDKPFKLLTEQEKCDLDERFKKSLLRYCNHKAFGGISFWDEPGYDSFEGIKRAKDVFDSVCPGKNFYVNMYPYYISPAQYQFGYWCNKEKAKATNPHFDVVEGGKNIDRYEFLYDSYIEQVGPDIFSYDAYPFCTFGSANTAIHEVLWELPQFLHAREEENGTPFAVFLQAGGMWEGSTHVRIPTYAEISLGVGVPLLYGAKVLQVFPYSYPNDWLNDDVAQAGLIDRYGEKTRIYYDYQKVFSFVRAMQGELVKSKLKGIIKSGKYENGLPCDEELKKIAWSECIFNGELSKKCSCEITSCKGVEKIESDVQCLTGVLDVDGKDGFFVVNNSATSCANYTIQFNNQVSCLIIQDGERKEVVTDKVTLSLSEGAFALITCR